jgi:hypothetical protein
MRLNNNEFLNEWERVVKQGLELGNFVESTERDLAVIASLRTESATRPSDDPEFRKTIIQKWNESGLFESVNNDQAKERRRVRYLLSLQAEIVNRIVAEDANPKSVGALLNGLIEGLTRTTGKPLPYPYQDENGNTKWEQDEATLRLVAALESLKVDYYRDANPKWTVRKFPE